MTTNSICATVRLDNTTLSSTATSTCPNSYIYTTTGDYYGYTVPSGMLPGSGNLDVPSRAEGEDTNMPITLSHEQVRRMLGLDCMPSSEDGYPTPKPVKVETYNDRVVKVTFEDGSFTKSVCSDNDTFDLDVGITICILKRVMGKNGHKLYNNMMRDIHKIMDENEKDKEKARKDKAERKAKQRKTELKAAAKKAKARQDQIDIQKTAFVEALRVSGIGSGDDLK